MVVQNFQKQCGIKLTQNFAGTGLIVLSCFMQQVNFLYSSKTLGASHANVVRSLANKIQ